jgi:putative aminopeptidase FrvX
MKKLKIDLDYLIEMAVRMISVPSPCGFTDSIVHCVGEELERLGVRFQLTRRGAIRADLPGKTEGPGRGLIAHLDTLGAMVQRADLEAPVDIGPCDGHGEAIVAATAVRVGQGQLDQRISHGELRRVVQDDTAGNPATP